MVTHCPQASTITYQEVSPELRVTPFGREPSGYPVLHSTTGHFFGAPTRLTPENCKEIWGLDPLGIQQRKGESLQ